MIGIVLAALIVFLFGVAVTFQGFTMWRESRTTLEYLFSVIIILIGVLILWLAGAGVNELFTHLK